jgi:hypothetical protein
MKKNLFIIALVFFAMNVAAKEGMYIEFKMASTSVNGTVKDYLSADGDSRNESSMVMSLNGNGQPYETTVIKLHSAPDVVYALNEKNKTYSVTDISKVKDREDDNDYDITVLGKERVNSYSCTHVKVKNKKTQNEMEMWLSKDIPQYERYAARVKNKYMGGSHLYQQLKEKGAEGFMVRMIMNNARGGQMQMDLVKAEQRNINESLFSLDGYAKTDAPANRNAEMQQKMQNMTPEERQKYIEQLQQQYAAPHQ